MTTNSTQPIGFGVDISPLAMEKLQPMKNVLVDYYREIIKDKPEAAHDELFLFFEFEKEFGDRVAREVCLPNQIDQGACIMSIIALVRKESTEPDYSM